MKRKLLILHLKKVHHDKLLAQKPFMLSHAEITSTEHPNKVELNVSSRLHSRYRNAIKNKKGIKFLKSDFSGGNINLQDIGKKIVNTASNVREVIKKHVPKDAVKLALTGVATALSPETAPANALLANTATNLLYGGKEKLKGGKEQKFIQTQGTILKGIPVKVGGYEIPLSTDIHTFATKKKLKQI